MDAWDVVTDASLAAARAATGIIEWETRDGDTVWTVESRGIAVATVRALRKAGHQVEFVDGHYSTARRKAALTRLMHRNLDTIVASKVFGTGVDAPDLQSVVLAAGGKSHIDALQNVGRGMRRRDKAGNVTKTAFPVYDITDIACGCRYEDAEGHPRYQHALCKWMDRHARERRKAYRGAGYTMVEHAP